jgi:magnesium chelatase family protein
VASSRTRCSTGSTCKSKFRHCPPRRCKRPQTASRRQPSAAASPLRASARARQGKPNARLSNKEIDRHCQADAAGAALLKQALARLNLSARAYHRVLRVARSIADLAGSESIAAAHIAEAVQYRRYAKD